MKVSAVVAIGFDRGGVGCDDGACRRLLAANSPELPRCGALRILRVFDLQKGVCRIPLIEVKLLSLSNKTSKVHPPQLRERVICEFQAAERQDSKERPVMGPVR